MQTPPTQETTELSFFQCLILILSVYVLGALFVQTVFNIPPAVNLLLNRIDFAICLIFIADFFVRLNRAPSKFAFLKWGWIDLASSIPMFEFLRWGRLVRIIKIFRILRAFRSTKVLINYLFQNRAKGTFATVATISLIMVIFSSIAILNLENTADANIKTPSDALWWAFATITTVGYGDRFPVTHEGRLVAAILMTTGVGLFGTFTAYVASLFMEAENQKDEDELQAVVKEVQLLKMQIETLIEQHRVTELTSKPFDGVR